MSFHIKDVHFDGSPSPTSYKLQFKYRTSEMVYVDMESDELPRKATQQELVDSLVAKLTQYEADIAVTNYDALKLQFENFEGDIG